MVVWKSLFVANARALATVSTAHRTLPERRNRDCRFAKFCCRERFKRRTIVWASHDKKRLSPPFSRNPCICVLVGCSATRWLERTHLVRLSPRVSVIPMTMHHVTPTVLYHHCLSNGLLFRPFNILHFVYARLILFCNLQIATDYVNVFNLSDKNNIKESREKKKERERTRKVQLKEFLCKNSAIYLESGISITRLKTLMALQFNFQGTSRDGEQDTKWQILRAT